MKTKYDLIYISVRLSEFGNNESKLFHVKHFCFLERV